MTMVLREFRASRRCQGSVAWCLAGLASTIVRKGCARSALVYAVEDDPCTLVWLSDYGTAAAAKEPDAVTAYLEGLEGGLEQPPATRTFTCVSVSEKQYRGAVPAYRLWMREIPGAGALPDAEVSDTRVVGTALYRDVFERHFLICLGLAGTVTPRALRSAADTPRDMGWTSMALMVDISRLDYGDEVEDMAARAGSIPPWMRHARSSPIPTDSLIQCAADDLRPATSRR